MKIIKKNNHKCHEKSKKTSHPISINRILRGCYKVFMKINLKINIKLDRNWKSKMYHN